MFMINLEARFKSKAWWIGTISNLILIAAYFQLDLTQYIGKDWQVLIGLIFGLLSQLGITVDTSTKGFSDRVIVDKTVQAINTKEETKTEATTTTINNTVTENSQATDNLNASSKITVDVPQE